MVMKTSSMTKRASLSRLLQSSTAQYFSLLNAMVLSGLILLFPNALVAEDGHYSHGLLSLCMLGISAGFVFGTGFIPRNRVLRCLLGPYLAWPAMLLSYAYLSGLIL